MDPEEARPENGGSTNSNPQIDLTTPVPSDAQSNDDAERQICLWVHSKTEPRRRQPRYAIVRTFLLVCRRFPLVRVRLCLCLSFVPHACRCRCYDALLLSVVVLPLSTPCPSLPTHSHSLCPLVPIWLPLPPLPLPLPPTS